MGKSLTETARAVLLKEGALPDVGTANPDRDATKKTALAATLKPNATAKDEPKKLAGEVQDLGTAVTAPTDERKGPASAAKATSKDTSKSAKAAVAPEKPKKQEQVQEDTEVEEEFEISEELSAFINDMVAEGASEEEISAAIAENFEIVEEDESETVSEEAEEDDLEISEEVYDFINDMVTEGADEDDITSAIAENFDFGDDLSEEQLQELSKKTLKSYIKKANADIEAKQAPIMAKPGNRGYYNDDDLKTNEKIRSRYKGVYAAKKKLDEEETLGEPEIEINMKEDIDALFAGEELSEEFKEKATTIFEAAVKSKVQEYVVQIKEAYAETLGEQVEQIKEELASNVDDYLNYVVEQWVSENEVAIESGLRTELTEDFISGLRNLFAEHYIDIPEEKVSVVEEITKKLQETEAKLEEQIEQNVAMHKVLSESKQNEIVAEACEGLTATQAEKLKNLVENVEYSGDKEFAAKVNTLKENYFPTAKGQSTVLDNNSTDASDNKGMIVETNSNMDKYIRTLGKKLPN